MGKIQQFLNGFYDMTFRGKGVFWGICGALLLILLVYLFADRLKEVLKKKSRLFFIVPAVLLALFVFLTVKSSAYIPINERTAGNPVSYAWEQLTSGTEKNLQYTSDVKDPKTGRVFEQTYDFGAIKDRLVFRAASEHVAEEYTVESNDRTASITFRPDGTYVFRASDGAAEETGRYAYVDKVLTITPDAGEEITVGKTSTKLRYVSAAQESVKQEFAVKELKNEFVVEETLERFPEEYTAVSADESTSITFRPDGTYTFRSADGKAGESGQYIFRDGKMTIANASGSVAFRKNLAPKIPWIVFAVAAALAMILIFVFHEKIRAFIDRHPLLWLLIPAALLIYFVYVAVGWNIWVSVSDWADGSLNASYGWGGFGQYGKMFSSPDFWSAVWNTLMLFAIIPICLLLGVGLALVMDQGLRGTAVFRTLILLPFALSFVVTGLIWQQMYNGSGGILMKFLELFGIVTNINWTSNEMVMFSIMLVMIWQFSGYVAVIFLAAIKNVPTSIINAAKLDGAYMPRIYMKMVLPQLKGATGSCITILAMYALRSFDLIFSLTGMTNPASTTLPIKMYVEAFSNDNYAYAAAISCFLLALVLVLILPLTYWTNRKKV